MPKKFRSVVIVLLFILVIPGGLFAAPLVRNGQGMAQSLYDPAIDTKGHITMDGSPVLPHLRFSLGLLLDFGFNSWFAVEQDKVQIEEGIPIADSMELTIDGYNHIMMERMIAARFQANFGLFNRLAIGFQIPIMVPTGQLYKYDAEGFEEHDHWSTNGFGDISLHIKGALLRSDWHPIGIAFIAQYFLPTGKSEYLTGEPGGGAFAFKAILDAEPFSWYRIGFNAGIRLPLGAKSNNYLSWDRENNDNNEHQNQCTGDCVDNEPRNLFKYGSSFYFGVGQSFRIFPEIMDLVLELYGNQLLSEAGNSNYLSMEGTVGLKFFIEESSFLMAGYAHGLPTADNQSGYGYQSMEHRAFLGFCYEPSMDILIREEDMDRDGDGIPDKNDACPDDPEDLNGIDDEDGCPENDMDGDGIKDQVDKCPLVPEDKDGDRDDDGCPESNEYVGAATASQTSDRDMDRIVDINDKCPDEPETYNGRDDEDGCPDEGDVIVTSGEIQILKKIYFEYNSAKIKPISFQILNEVAATIVNNPQIDKIEIQGHADERGKDSYNLKLTKRRAKSVRDYLTKKGVPPGKLQSQGYGEYCPINSASNEQAWEENRRVEFKVVALNGSSTGIKLGCALADQKGIK